jgi:GT2 family glycosyltransferase
MLAKISVLVVNLNNLEYTKQCIEDLLNQDVEFSLRLIDQNSSEEGTSTYFNNLYEKYIKGDFNGKISFLEIIYSEFNCSLNNLWNYFVSTSSTKFLCLLNNDVRLSPNFLSTSIAVLEKEPLVGFVNHVTNNLNYSQWSDTLEYKIMEQPYRQGWDLTFKKSFYNQIPEELKFFYGDDYLYSKLYSSNYKGAYILNSPMLHFESSTTTEKGGARDCTPDGIVYHSLELEHKNLKFNEELSKWKPQFINITKK